LQDERFAQLSEAGVDPELSDGRLATEPVEVGAHVGRCVVEALPLETETPDVQARGRDLDLLREREEGEHEGDDDRTQHETKPVRPTTGTDGATDAPAIERRRLGDPRRPRRARQSESSRTCALVDGHGSVAEREADAWTAWIEETERVGLAGRSPLAELELEAFGVVAAVLPSPHLVRAAPVGFATVDV